jgi:hypothetical protein
MPWRLFDQFFCQPNFSNSKPAITFSCLQLENSQLENSHLAALQLFEIERLAVGRAHSAIREFTEPLA